MNDIFENLNEKQIEAVTSTEGYVRIIAGAGSGKTKTLTHRYAFLVEAAGIHPGNILCVTFTNKAAGEMKKRVRTLVGEGSDTSLITTYHGFCVRVLREDIGRLFYPENFTILDERDQKKILEEIYTELELKLDRASFENILGKIHDTKVTSDYVPMFVSGEFGVVLGDSSDENIIRMYMQREKNVFGLDFDDLISFTFSVFESHPEVLGKWQERLHYIEVDEFQDSSKRELKLITMLSAEHRNLFVVGDPDQNIYEWRGADMSILVDFDKTFPGCETIFLNRNYRSTPKILKCANTVIANNKNRIPKELYTKAPAGDDVIHLHAKNETAEGEWIAAEIKRLVKFEGYSYRDIAILYRSGFLSRFAEQALSSASIPYELYGSVRFYDRMEIRDAVAYLRMTAFGDNASFERIINTPKRMFGKVKMTLLKKLAAQDNLTYYDALKKYADIPEFANSGAKEFILLIEKHRSEYKNRTVAETVSALMKESGYEQYIRRNGSMERLDNLAEFERSATEQERERGEEYSLEEFLADIALKTDAGEDEEKSDKVKLMTIHSSKGLEFPVCFVCGFTEGIFPSGRTIEERKDAGLEEERRLCFVALTRAMKRLYLTESEGNAAEGSRASSKKRPSRFIYEIGEENYSRIGTIPKELERSRGAERSSSAASRQIGDEVEHPVFGHGKIESIDEKRGVYNIRFDKNGVLKPIGTDYDFDKWKNIAEMRRKALSDAKQTEENKTEPPIQASAQPVIPEPASDEDKKRESEILKSQTGYQLRLPELIPDVPRREQSEEAKAPAVENDDNRITIDVIDDLPDSPQKRNELPERYKNAEYLKKVDENEQNLWKRDDVPHEGWTCVDIIDLGEPVGVCRMCGYQIIRYVHIMEHPQYRRRIGAGCICAGKMEGNPEAARERENAFKNRQSRRETFLGTKLKKSKNGNEYFKYKGSLVTVIPDKFKKGYCKTVYKGEFSPSYPNKEDALSDLFDKIDPK